MGWDERVAVIVGVYRHVMYCILCFPVLVLDACHYRYQKCIRGSCMRLWYFRLCGSVMFLRCGCMRSVWCDRAWVALCLSDFMELYNLNFVLLFASA